MLFGGKNKKDKIREMTKGSSVATDQKQTKVLSKMNDFGFGCKVIRSACPPFLIKAAAVSGD